MKIYLAAMTSPDLKFLEHAIQLAGKGVEAGQGGPFGCVIVKDGKIVGEGCNQVLCTNDPTAHAEVVAIRAACAALQTFQLTDCDIYASCEPCPMCLGAIYWARPRRVIFANTQQQAAAIDFDDAHIYQEIEREYANRRIPFIHVPMESGERIFEAWKNKTDKKEY